jgi:hypothetical protein
MLLLIWLNEMIKKRNEKAVVWQKCLGIIRDKLISEGKITDHWIGKEINNKILYKWKKKGYLPEDIPYGFSSMETLIEFRDKLNSNEMVELQPYEKKLTRQASI